MPLEPDKLLTLFSATTPGTPLGGVSAPSDGEPVFTSEQVDELERQINEHGETPRNLPSG